jgi:general secretion pathway protein I
MTEPAPRTAGFTLIEVLVALVILAIASGFAFGVVSDSFDHLSQSELEQQAVMVAEGSLARLGHDLPVQSGRMAGTDGPMHWAIEIAAPMADPPPAEGWAAYPVNVDVDWRDGRVARHLRLQSVRLGPQPPPE